MKRLQFELPEERVKELDNLAERTGLKTRVQLFNAALTLFEWAVRERETGRIIASIDEKRDRYKEVDMPGLPHISTETQKEESSNVEALLADLARHSQDQEQVIGLFSLARSFSIDAQELLADPEVSAAAKRANLESIIPAHALQAPSELEAGAPHARRAAGNQKQSREKGSPRDRSGAARVYSVRNSLRANRK
jgi:metal-responsive CopG/Arc/MetJ family transcriptional regulator